MDNTKPHTIDDFSGGYCGNLPPTSLKTNQALDLDNIIIKPNGTSFRTCPGTENHHHAYKDIQDLRYAAVALGRSGLNITIAYTGGATAGSEVVTVVGNAISVQIESGVSTANQIRTKINASAAATALIVCTVSGTGTNAQTTQVATSLIYNPLGVNGSGTAIQGIGYYLQQNGTEYLVIVGNGQFATFANLSSAPDGVSATGSLTLSQNKDYFWDFITFNNNLVAFGGIPSTPDVPFVWTGTGNATALGGSAPQAYGAFAANNRMFAFRTSTNPSTIYWTIIGNEADWTGTGSGNAVIGSISDNQKITGAQVLNTNEVVVFKENSSYILNITEAPFPSYTLYSNVGCAGKKASVMVDGVCYFITSQGKMKATTGSQVISFPEVADNLWSAVLPSRYPYIHGFRIQGVDYDWLVWSVTTSGTTNNVAIIWDLLNKCWVRRSTGFKFNCTCADKTGTIYAGGYDAMIYRPLYEGVFSDASESSPGTITGYWRSGWLNPSNLTEITQVKKAAVAHKVKSSGNITFKYGFDFSSDSQTVTLSQTHASLSNKVSNFVLSGRGNLFQYLIQQSSSTVDSEVYNVTLRGKSYGQKVFTAS